MLKKLHHVEYRCRDAAETVDFYTNGIGLKFAAALINHASSTGIQAANNNVFFEMEDGSYICFFEILGSKEPLVPVAFDWAQHLALEVRDEARAEAICARLRARGVDVVGPVHHGALGSSWHFYDPSGHRMELIVKPEVPATAIWDNFSASAYDDLAKWVEMKKGAGAHADCQPGPMSQQP
ncbi:VOC family protein [Ralstonia pseudosolanacearum]|uniref:Glyoxalase family protein n=1 Tax=Ralstonia solanacearum TaxID=305 RepID=A0A0S4WZW9_RALSL|nr:MULTISPECIES: VOC family protein [Ralstonia]QWQ13814.1 VOC family protein [Ralstonia solanacearum]MBX9428872.1 VOC family protein [Ralstonia pseudosolanacearum]MDO3555599.1 VOC family protein [Ralstonia pseudosolanacearum]MDO3575216.1 VOC family protein [Ralstonia pseudosolanacearum]MDO3585103.1 VOC family protein [Ralstonia pseudosolanacearum]